MQRHPVETYFIYFYKSGNQASLNQSYYKEVYMFTQNQYRWGSVALFLVLALLGGIVIPAVTASPSATLEAETVEGNPGDIVNVSIVVDGASDVAGYQTNLTYDSDVVQVRRITGVDVSDPIANINNNRGWVSFTQAQAKGIKSPTLARISFEIVGESGRQTRLSFVESDTLVSDAKGNAIPLSLSGGLVRVASQSPSTPKTSATPTQTPPSTTETSTRTTKTTSTPTATPARTTKTTSTTTATPVRTTKTTSTPTATPARTTKTTSTTTATPARTTKTAQTRSTVSPTETRQTSTLAETSPETTAPGNSDTNPPLPGFSIGIGLIALLLATIIIFYTK
jgi:hypothetical protein